MIITNKPDIQIMRLNNAEQKQKDDKDVSRPRRAKVAYVLVVFDGHGVNTAVRN